MQPVGIVVDANLGLLEEFGERAKKLIHGCKELISETIKLRVLTGQRIEKTYSPNVGVNVREKEREKDKRR